MKASERFESFFQGTVQPENWKTKKKKGRQRQHDLFKNAVPNHQMLFQIGLDEGCGMEDHDQ